MKQILPACANIPDPERHHLHVTSCPCFGYRIFSETAFNLNQAENQLRIESGAGSFVMHGLEESMRKSASGMRLDTRRDIPPSHSSASCCEAKTSLGAARSDTARCNTPRTLAESTSSACVPACAVPAKKSGNEHQVQDARHKFNTGQEFSLHLES